ncbi:recombination-associated protein RdgC [Salinimonas chungwhensis]|uniref:recombination-associated protein RdgC n=1 Tax=Salinimonas chungwhensis TaxID=265425 RepID=UPI00037537FF|nr:recombination-associated protein RdgC [Salinimonas chungwhensis]
MFGHFLKSAVAYKYELGDGETITEHKLKQFVPLLKHVDIKPAQKESFGFSSVVGYHDPEHFFHKVGTWYLLSLTVEDKKIKKNKLDRRVAEKKRELAKAKSIELSALSKQESQQVRDKVLGEMLSEQEADENYLNIIIDTDNRWLFFSDSSTRTIKKFTGLMQKHYSSFRVSEFCTQGIDLHLTSWLYNPDESLPEEIDLEDSASLQSEQSAKATLKKQNLQSDEVAMLINHGKKCLELSISYLQRVSFRLTSNCQLKGIKLSDDLIADVAEIEDPQSRVEELEPFWEVMCSELTSIYQWLDELQNKPV